MSSKLYDTKITDVPSAFVKSHVAQRVLIQIVAWTNCSLSRRTNWKSGSSFSAWAKRST